MCTGKPLSCWVSNWNRFGCIRKSRNEKRRKFKSLPHGPLRTGDPYAGFTCEIRSIKKRHLSVFHNNFLYCTDFRISFRLPM